MNSPSSLAQSIALRSCGTSALGDSCNASVGTLKVCKRSASQILGLQALHAIRPLRHVVGRFMADRRQLWDRRLGKETSTMSGPDRPVHALCACSWRLYTGGSHSAIQEWDLRSSRRVRVLEGHQLAVRGLAIHGDFLFSVSDDYSVRRWHLPSWTPAFPHDAGHPGQVRHVGVTDKGCIVTGSVDGTIVLWSDTLVELGRFATPGNEVITAMTEREGHVVTAHGRGINVWGQRLGWSLERELWRGHYEAECHLSRLDPHLISLCLDHTLT